VIMQTLTFTTSHSDCRMLHQGSQFLFSWIGF
jgi:hypothetical protein